MLNRHLGDLSHLPKLNYLQSCPYPKRTHALLSIRPEYVARILDGSKRFEFRRTTFARSVDVVVVYATAPIGMVVAEFDIKSILTRSVRRLWQETCDHAGIDRSLFFRYYEGKSHGYAIEIGEVRAYEESLCLRKHFGMKPPQSYAYLDGTWPLNYCA